MISPSASTTSQPSFQIGFSRRGVVPASGKAVKAQLRALFPSVAVVLKHLRAGRPACLPKTMRIMMVSPVVGLAAKVPNLAIPGYAGPSSNGFCSPPMSLYVHLFLTQLRLALTLFQLTIYSIVTIIICLLTWFNVFQHADVVRVGNRPELVVSTIAAVAGIITSLIGWAGILLNNRSFLAVYTFFLWICFALLVIPGYITYKRRTFNLEGKINSQWSRTLGDGGRLRVQNELGCCGYFSPFVEATVSQTCYARSILPGCKHAYLQFQRTVLQRWFTTSFSLVPLHLFVMIAGLLCSNHVTYRFGKGMMPKAYRLSMNSMAVIMDNYAR